jgi:uncharacterized phage protein gp47/JayE
MSPPIPTTKELKDNLIATISASINQTIPLLPKSFVRVLSWALAAVIIGLYKYAGFIFLQIFVATASFKETTVNGRRFTPLIFWGRLIGVGDPDAPVQAQLIIDITVINQSGSLIAVETNVIGSLNGVTYTLQSDILLNAPVVQGTFLAVSDPLGLGGAGSQGNLDNGDIVSFTTPFGNVAPDALVDSRPVDGVDGQSEESYRQEVGDLFSRRAQGGAGLDYVIWGKEVPGIINIYPYTGDAGHVLVFAEATEASSGSPDGIPTPAQLTAVEEAIQNDSGGLALNRPIGSFVIVDAITRTGFTVDVTGLTGENLTVLKTNIDQALTLHLSEREPFIDGVTLLPKKQDITRDDIRSIVNDFANADNGSFQNVEVKFTLSGSFFAVYTLQKGEKAKLTIVNYLTGP